MAVGRYLTGAGKAISASELESYVTAGIGTWLVFEVGAADDEGGEAAGAAHAQQANAALEALRLPVSCPVYFAVDHDVTNPASAVPYFQGIASVRPPATNGDYGEGALCQLLQQLGLTAYHWQSESKSFPDNAATLPITHIQQVFGGAPLPDTDLDILCKPDFGQWPRPAGPVPAPTPSATLTLPLEANPMTYDLFAFIFRDKWKQYRSDPVGQYVHAPGAAPVFAVDLMWYAFHLPTTIGGFDGSMQLALAWLLDDANDRQVLRPQFVGSE